MNAIRPIEQDLDPLEIDPRPCDLCGRTIDRHEMVDHGEGPEFFCLDVPPDEFYDAARIVRRWELDDSRDRWRHTGEAAPRPVPAVAVRRPYRTAQSTIDAFWYVVRNEGPEYLKGWLTRHPADATFLLKIWKQKNARETPVV